MRSHLLHTSMILGNIQMEFSEDIPLQPWTIWKYFHLTENVTGNYMASSCVAADVLTFLLTYI